MEPATHSSAKPGESDSWRHAGMIFLGMMAAYFGLHILTRSLLSNSLHLDEAEQLVLTQDWRWGYGSQPPLYNWIQKVLFSVFGIHVFTLSLLKNTLLWSLYFFVYRTARDIFFREKHAVVAAASLLFIPEILWESQRDQTHLVLATACAAATLFVFVRLLRTGKPACYVGFGALVGLGLMSKYNYLFFVVALVLAALTIPAFRHALLTPKALLSLLVLILITAPHLSWIVHHEALALSQSGKFNMEPNAGAAAYLQGILRFVKVVGGFAFVPVLLYTPLLYRAFDARHQRVARDEERAFLKLLLRTFGLALLLSLLLVLGFRVTDIRYRWLDPLLFALPILLVGVAREQLGSTWAKLLLGFAGATAVAVLIAINGTVLGANFLHRAHNLNIPHAALADELRKAGFSGGTIIADRAFVGGNLKMQFKNSRVIVPEIPYDMPLPQGPKLIAWSANAGKAPSAGFLEFAGRLCGIAPQEMKIQHIEVPSENGPRHSEHLDFALLNGGR